MKSRIALFALLLFAIFGCQSAPKPTGDTQGHEEDTAHSDEENSVHLTPDQESIADINVQTAELRFIQASLEVPGTVASTTKGRAVVTPPVGGRLIKLNVQPGDSVRQGQAIGVIESTELAEAWANIGDAEQSRDSAKAMLSEAKSQALLSRSKLQASEQTLKRQQEFVKAGAYNTVALQDAQSQLSDAQSELLGYQNELATHKEKLRRLENLYREGLVSKSDLQEAQLEVQQDEINLSRAQSKVTAAKTTYDREKNIAEKGLLNSRELQTAEADVRAAKLERDRADIAVRSAEAALRNAEKSVGNARTTYRTYSGGAASSSGRVNLIAPISGVITHLDVTQGQAVDRIQAICEVENLSSVWITANVSERDASKIKKGASLAVEVAAFPGVEFEGIVQIVGGRLDPKTRSIPVQCLVINDSNRLKPGMFATVKVAFGTAQELLAVPSTAVVKEGEKSFVYVQQGAEFVRHEVTIGVRQGEWVAIKSGIEPGEKIAVEGAFVLKSQQAKDDLKGHDH